MFYSEQKKQITTYNRRTFFLFLLKLSLFTAVGWRIYNIQILDSSKYKFIIAASGSSSGDGGLTLMSMWPKTKCKRIN